MRLSQLYLHNRSIESFFELLGSDENDITYSLGWTLHSCPVFLRRFLKKTIRYQGDGDGVTIRLQDYNKTQGITDIEINKPPEFHVIIEAKKGWNLPERAQLRKYAERFSNDRHRTRAIVVLSECSEKYAEEHLESRKVGTVPVRPLSWKSIARVAEEAVSKGKHREKRLLREMLLYLRRVVTVQDIESNKVFVVSLSGIGITNWMRNRVYFHPVGHGWPKAPPNYVACRFEGKLQSINHVDGYERVDPRELYRRRLIPRVSLVSPTTHFLYTLGPPIVPPGEVRAGRRVVRDSRVWCMLDTLLTSKTISQALALSKKRSKMAERMGE